MAKIVSRAIGNYKATITKPNYRAMYYPKLDSIRCFAAFAVVFAHIFQIWTWPVGTTMVFPLGHTGVIVFFVLSGFLITGLLVDEPAHAPFGVSLKNFYMRRTLRIFPIYYLYLAVVFSFNLGQSDEWSLGIRETGAWPWLYMTNILMFNTGKWLSFNSQLWSLAVEEQFYLVWPFIVLGLRQRVRMLVGVLVGICVFSVGLRAILVLNGYSASPLQPQIMVFTLTNLDFLAIGALLALAQRAYGKNLTGEEARKRLSKIGLVILVGGIIAYLISVQGYDAPLKIAVLHWAFGNFFIAAAAVGGILYALYSSAKYSLLHNPLTIRLGKISYAVYLFHNPLVAHYREIAGLIGFDPTLGVEYDPNTNLLSDWTLPWWQKIVPLLFCLALVILVAELSYRLIEIPILKLKDRFRTKTTGEAVTNN